jgi:hypothetical protein
MDKTEKITFNTTLLLVVVIILSTLLIFILTPSVVSPTKRLFGYITGVYIKDKTTYLEFDQAEWLLDTQTEFPASTACKLDGGCPQCSLPITASCISKGYYIRNPGSDTQIYPIAKFTKAGTLIVNPDWNQSDPNSPPYLTLNLDQFTTAYTTPSSPYSYIKSAPYDITVIGGTIIIINQHYLP